MRSRRTWEPSVGRTTILLRPLNSEILAFLSGTAASVVTRSIQGGKCHRCGQSLRLSPLTELRGLSESEELGYDLGEWEDVERGEIIELIIEAGVRHRFDGDDLIITAVDEEVVDTIFEGNALGEESADENVILEEEVGGESDEFQFDEGDGEDTDLIESFDTANPYLHRLFSMPEFGDVPSKAVLALRERRLLLRRSFWQVYL